jgi:hypothetical protein
LQLFSGHFEDVCAKENGVIRFMMIKMFVFEVPTLIFITIASVHNSFISHDIQKFVLISLTIDFLGIFIANLFIVTLLIASFHFNELNEKFIRVLTANESPIAEWQFSKYANKHKDLKTFTVKIVKLFSKICIAIFLCAFLTTLTEVCN